MLAAVLGFVTFLALLPGPASGSSSETGLTCVTHLGWSEPLGPLSCSRPAVAGVGVVVWLTARQLLLWRAAGRRRRVLAGGVALLVSVVAGLTAPAVLGSALLAPERAAFLGEWSGPPRVGGPLAVRSYEGAAHCAWDTVVFLEVVGPAASPPGGQVRTYVRDPDGALGGVRLAGHLLLHTSLPPGSRSTGFVSDGVGLWSGPDDADEYAYLVRDGQVERWPRAVDPPGCA